MRIASIDGRATLLDGVGGGLDIAMASDGRFPAESQALFEHWEPLGE